MKVEQAQGFVTRTLTMFTILLTKQTLKGGNKKN